MNLGPDFNAWQSHFQPEETGRVHGSEGVPRDDDDVSDWEERVCEGVGSCIEQIRQPFHRIEQQLSREFDHVVESYRRHYKSYSDRVKQLSRDVSIPVSGRWNIILTGLVVVSAAFFLSMLMTYVFSEPVLYVLSGTLMSFGLSVPTYLAGIVVRQAQKLWFLLAAIVGLTLIFGLLVWIGIHYSGGTDGIRPVLLSGVAGILITIAIPLVAALSRDADANLERFWKRYREDLKLAADLKARREENQRQSTSAAQQIVHNGRKTIRVYRDSNTRYRMKSGYQEPAFFNRDPDIRDITSEDFPLDNKNEYEVQA